MFLFQTIFLLTVESITVLHFNTRYSAYYQLTPFSVGTVSLNK
jgi:hypothetical protein